MKHLILFIACLGTIYIAAAQKTYTSKSLGFSIEIPADWIQTDSTMLENEASYSFSPEQAEKIMKLHKGSTVLTVLMKRDPSSTTGIIPTIKINARATATTDINLLKDALKKSVDNAMSTFPGFRYIAPFTTATINGVPAIVATISYALPQDGEPLPARTFFYIFLRKGYFIQVGCSDTGDKEDEKPLFERLIKTVTFR